ncbi:MAG: ABC transporter permease [Bacteroidia bacterium]|nr:ABC transporter permease [Bacteroidia bacterium]
MNFSLYIAKRYLISKKSRNIINIISAISITGVAIGTMALIVILSVHNGFDGLIKSLFNTFDPDIKITVASGKSFRTDAEIFHKIKSLPEVEYYTEVIEENALLKYNDRQYIVTVKGVDSVFMTVTGIDSMIIEGEYMLNFKNQPVVNRNAKILSNPENAINSKLIFPAGIFKIHPELDIKYIIVPIDFARELFGYPDEVTALEIKLKNDARNEYVQSQIEQMTGTNFFVLDREQQHEFLNKTIKSEKWVIYLILLFILMIASFNIVGSLTMLIIDKKKDVAVLRSLGTTMPMIRKIFLFEGWLISIAGAIIGLMLGFILAYCQQQFGLLKIHGTGSFIIDAYPRFIFGKKPFSFVSLCL